MTIVDGRALAAEVRASVAAEIQAMSRAPKLGILACNPNFETETYLELKEKLAATLGVVVERVVLPVTATTEEVLQSVAELSRRNDGIIVQLPLPAHIDRE
jgi:methylenetetrahydrofolate dehydrogenase (NADP+) / methenyltetrahydrofolate cyclohydrolase